MTVDDIRPPRPIPGMDKPLPDYSERLARRTGVNADLVAAKHALIDHELMQPVNKEK